MTASASRILLLHDDDSRAALVRARVLTALPPACALSEATLGSGPPPEAPEPPTLCLLVLTSPGADQAASKRAVRHFAGGAPVLRIVADAADPGASEPLDVAAEVTLEELTPALLRTALGMALARARLGDALRHIVAQRDALVENASDIICLMDEEATFTYVSPSIGRTIGYGPEEMLSRSGFEFVQPDDMARIRAAFAHLIATPGRRERVEFRFRGRTGAWHRLAVTAVNRLHDPILASVVINARDVTAQRATEAALRASEEQYRALFDAHPQPMWVYDRETLRFTAANESALRHYGYARGEFLAMTILDIRPPEDRARVRDDAHRWPLGEYAVGLRSRHVKKDGTPVQVELTKFGMDLQGRHAVLVLVNDLTERLRLEAKIRETEEQLRLAQRMESVGRLAGGIAHDFNNLLTVIQGNAQLLLADVGADSPFTAELEDIDAAAERAAQLTRQLLAFSRQQVLQPRLLDLSEVVLGTRRMLERLIGEDIALEFATAPDLGLVHADPGQVEQVLLNLAVNARDAMPAGGTLVIETANAEMDSRGEEMYPFMPAGTACVRLRVTDTGVGMDALTREHVFEPFFTTKGPAKGTGLGLSTVYGIVKQSGGYVWVDSEPGRGTSIEVYLPCSGSSEEAEIAGGAARYPAPAGTEMILLVEDDDAVRTAARRMLAHCGYTVLTAATPDEALHLHASYGSRIRLLIVDVVLPGMSGPELATRLLETTPTARVLFISGYADHAAADGAAGAALLQKPFTGNALAHAAREVLDAPAREAETNRNVT